MPGFAGREAALEHERIQPAGWVEPPSQERSCKSHSAGARWPDPRPLRTLRHGVSESGWRRVVAADCNQLRNSTSCRTLASRPAPMQRPARCIGTSAWVEASRRPRCSPTAASISRMRKAWAATTAIVDCVLARKLLANALLAESSPTNPAGISPFTPLVAVRGDGPPQQIVVQGELLPARAKSTNPTSNRTKHVPCSSCCR